MQNQKENNYKSSKTNLNFMYKSQNTVNIPILHKRTQSSNKAKTFKNTSGVKKTVRRIMTNLFPIQKFNNNNINKKKNLIIIYIFLIQIIII